MNIDHIEETQGETIARLKKLLAQRDEQLRVAVEGLENIALSGGRISSEAANETLRMIENRNT